MPSASQKYRIADIATKFHVAKRVAYDAYSTYKKGKMPKSGAIGDLCRAMEAAGISWAQVITGPNVPGKKTGGKRHHPCPAPAAEASAAAVPAPAEAGGDGQQSVRIIKTPNQGPTEQMLRNLREQLGGRISPCLPEDVLSLHSTVGVQELPCMQQATSAADALPMEDLIQSIARRLPHGRLVLQISAGGAA